MMRIPRQLLIHSAYADSGTTKDMWGAESYKTRTELSFIRVAATTKLSMDKSNNQVQLSAVLIYDCRSSRPRNFDFNIVDRIVFSGTSYRIVRIDPKYDGRQLHHYEVELAI